MSVSLYGSGQTVIQVVQTVKNDTYTGSISGTGGVTNLGSVFQVSITPQSTTSKILILATFNISSASVNQSVDYILTKNGTPITGAIGTASSTRTSVTSGFSAYPTNYSSTTSTINYLDSPNTTSPVVYSISVHDAWGGVTSFIMNKTISDADAAYTSRLASMITAMEISGS